MSDEILVLVEHRRGEIRDVTFEMLGKGRELAALSGARLIALLLGHQMEGLANAVAGAADIVEIYDDSTLKEFNSERYQALLARVYRDRRPLLLVMGHTAFGVDLAPSLAEELGVPLITDATAIEIDGSMVVAERPSYGGKLVARVRARERGAVVTVQPGAFPAVPPGPPAADMSTLGVEVGGEARKRFVEFVQAAADDVDITRSEIVVSVGRGIGDPEKLPMIERLAAALGGVVGCSRPVVDKKWLPRSRQVGISGKLVQPKLYLAVGISGSFQHLAGIKRAGMVVAINKDPNAPIFRVADYGFVGDLFDIVPALTDRIAEAKARR
jgi:electron transfer flavoprotein alpha subunit